MVCAVTYSGIKKQAFWTKAQYFVKQELMAFIYYLKVRHCGKFFFYFLN